jgi:hypothetical protein
MPICTVNILFLEFSYYFPPHQISFLHHKGISSGSCMVCENWLHPETEHTHSSHQNVGSNLQLLPSRPTNPSCRYKSIQQLARRAASNRNHSEGKFDTPEANITEATVNYLWNPMYFLNVKFIALTTECESDILKLPTDCTSRTVLAFSEGYNYRCVCVRARARARVCVFSQFQKFRSSFNTNVYSCSHLVQFSLYVQLRLLFTPLHCNYIPYIFRSNYPSLGVQAGLTRQLVLSRVLF